MKNNVLALIQKDLTLLFRNRVLSILPLAMVILLVVIYLLMPRTVDEELNLAVVGAVLPQTLVEGLADEGVELIYLQTEADVKREVNNGNFIMGIIFPEDLLSRLSTGDKPQVTAVFGPGILPEMKAAEIKLIEQIVFLLQGDPIAIEVEEEVILGPDMTGRQIPMRGRLLPLFAIFIILMEIMGLGTLIAEEYDRGTVSALLVTSLPLGSLLTAKAVTGLGLAFLQAALLLAVTGTLANHPLLLLSALLLASLLAVGFGFLAAAFSRDMMTVIAWSMLAMIMLFLPAFNVILPGMMSSWIKILPTYYLTDLLHQVTHFEAGWADMWRHLAILLVFDLVLIVLGSLAIRRKRV